MLEETAAEASAMFNLGFVVRRVVVPFRHLFRYVDSPNIRRQINIDLKKECIEKKSESPSKIIEKVLESNVQYKNLYDKGFSPKINSMKMTINRHRKFMSSVNVKLV